MSYYMYVPRRPVSYPPSCAPSKSLGISSKSQAWASSQASTPPAPAFAWCGSIRPFQRSTGSFIRQSAVNTDDGVPAGYFELEQMPDAVVEIKYFGLLAGFTGRGLGAHMLTEAVERAFAIGASRVILDTCSLDHPGALAHYQARGFRVYNVEMKPRALPDDPPGPWEGSDDAAVPADSKRRFRN
jgi:ribosomal protein S18 acetylase RimI-like enzyme